MNDIKKAIIPAAGFGTRFLPATKSLPKEMLPIVDTPTIHYIVKEVVDSGIEDILIITSRSKKAIEDYFDRAPEIEALLRNAGKNKELEFIRKISSMANVIFVRQKEMKGSGDALKLAKSFVGADSFAMLYGDDLIYNPAKPCTAQLIEAYNNTGKCIIGVQKVEKSELGKYGIVKPGASKGKYTEVLGFVEKPRPEDAPSQLASMGRYILTNEIFDALDVIKVAPNKELYVTDAIDVIARSTGVYAYEFEGTRYDIGDKLGFLKATVEYALRNDSLKDDFMKYLKGITE